MQWNYLFECIMQSSKKAPLFQFIHETGVVCSHDSFSCGQVSESYEPRSRVYDDLADSQEGTVDYQGLKLCATVMCMIYIVLMKGYFLGVRVVCKVN